MAKSKSKPGVNGYDDEDFRTVLAELDEMDDEIQELKSSMGGKIAAIKKRQQNRIKIADKELNIPPALLRKVRAQRKLEQQMQDLVDDLPDDLVEVFEDAAGQFSLFAPEGDGVHPASGAAVTAAKPAAVVAAEKRKAADAEREAAEQVEGERVLAELAGNTVN